ncbi:MAG TPA: methyltransferase [Polyangiaceae bacterium]|jgi:HemK-related putative methylase|nr:methyltransferase [Polyangiaceae bacterium]
MVVARTLGAVRRRIARPILHGLRRPIVLRRIGRASEVRLLGLRLRTDPAVFHPVCFSSSRLLAEHLLARPLRGLSLLDMGTGAGPIAIAAAAAGASVTACDVNPRAVALARENAALNSVGPEIVESNLFAALANRQFDLICFNIPFYRREPVSPLDAAFYAGRELETVRRFADDCARHLLADGRVVIIFSEDCDGEFILSLFAERGLCLESKYVSRKLMERFHIVWFRAIAR